MAGAERQQRSWGKAAFAIGSGIAAGAMTLRKPINDQDSYSMHLAELSNLAFNKEDVAGRITGKKQLDASIRKALRLGGGTPEQAFAALQSMIRSGSMTVTEALQSLPGVMMNASATGSDPEAVANLQASAYNFGLSKKDALSALSVTTTAAQHGRVGVPLLAREMPKALESAKSAGFKGRAGFSQVAALFEAAAIGAGTPEEAATNVTNLLAELTSSNLSNNAKHITIKGKGVDFKALSVKDAAKGLTPLDTVNNLVDTALKYDKNYQGLGKKLANTQDESERTSLEAQRDLIEGQYISQLLPNQYSKNAFQLYRRQIPYFNKLQHEQMEQFDLPAEKRSAELDFDLIKQEPEFQMHQAQNEKLFATNDAIAPVAKTLADYSSKLAQEFPGLTTAAAGAAVAITALGAAAAVKSGADLLMGRGGGVTAGKAGGGMLGRLKVLFGKGGAGVAEGAASAGKAAGMLKLVPFLGEAAMAYEGSQDFPLIDIQRGEDQAAKARAKGGESNPAMMALMPKSAGALDALDEIRKWFSGSGQDKPADKAAAAAPAPAPTTVNLSVMLDGREIAAAVEQRVDRDARRK
ncbi:MAG: phage tail tape measure protein [Serratia symbiotica]|nr:phage tail tape measure protein [Serratia symbiotica]